MALGNGISSKPTEAQTGQFLTPAIIANYIREAGDADLYHYATAALFNATGEEAVHHTLCGVNAVGGKEENNLLIFTFASLFISAPGDYQIRIDVYVAEGGATHKKTLGQFPIRVV